MELMGRRESAFTRATSHYHVSVYHCNKGEINLSRNKSDKFHRNSRHVGYTGLQRSRAFQTSIGKRAYSAPTNPSQLVELITQYYCTANKARYLALPASQAAEIRRGEWRDIKKFPRSDCELFKSARARAFTLVADRTQADRGQLRPENSPRPRGVGDADDAISLAANFASRRRRDYYSQLPGAKCVFPCAFLFFELPARELVIFFAPPQQALALHG